MIDRVRGEDAGVGRGQAQHEGIICVLHTQFSSFNFTNRIPLQPAHATFLTY